MAESSEGGSFDIFHAMQLGVSRLEMKSGSKIFFRDLPEYGDGKFGTHRESQSEQWDELRSILWRSD